MFKTDEHKGNEMNNKSKSTFWVLEKSDGIVYFYKEEGDHHLAAEESRQSENLVQLGVETIEEECNVTEFMPDNSYYLIPAAAPAAVKKPSKAKSKKPSQKPVKKTKKK